MAVDDLEAPGRAREGFRTELWGGSSLPRTKSFTSRNSLLFLSQLCCIDLSQQIRTIICFFRGVPDLSKYQFRSVSQQRHDQRRQAASALVLKSSCGSMATQQHIVFAETIRGMKLAMRRRDNGMSTLVTFAHPCSHRWCADLTGSFRLGFGRIYHQAHQSRQQA